MSKMTFVVDFPDGQEPAVSSATDILGGELVGVTFGDMRDEFEWHPVAEIMPREGEFVITHNGECASVGRCVAGEWRDSDNRSYLTPITHWVSMPESPE